MTDLVLLERPAEGVVLLRINRPEARNALNLEVRKLLAKHLAECGEDTTTRAIVLTGNEKSFAAGADIKEMADAGTIEMLQRGRAQAVARDCRLPQAGDRGGERLRARRRLRARHDLRHHRRRRVGPLRAARSQHRHHSRRRRHAAPDARRRQVQGDEVHPHRRAVLGEGGVRHGARERSRARPRGRGPRDRPRAPDRRAAAARDAAREGGGARRNGRAAVRARSRWKSSRSQILFSSQDQKEGMRAFIEKRKPKFSGR